MSSTAQPTGIAGETRLPEAQRRSINWLIFRSLVGVASAAALVRVMGMLGQIVTSAHFGGGATMDAYIVASGLPILIAQFVTGAIEASVIPVYARIRRENTREHTTAVFSTLVTLALLLGALGTATLLLFRRQLIFLTAPALDPHTMDLAVNIAPIVFPVLLLMGVIGLLECILNVEGQFSRPAYAGMLVPLATAVWVLLAAGSLGVAAVGVGMVVGLCLQLTVDIFCLHRARINYRPTLNIRTPEVMLVLVAAWPALMNALINQASPLVDQVFASFLSIGSISALTYALKLVSVPVGVVFMTLGRVALPYLSRQSAAYDMTGFKGTLRLYLWVVAIGTALLSTFLFLLAHPVVRLLFQRGAFSPLDTDHTATTLRGFMPGLVPMGIGFLLARAFSALGKNRILMFVTLFAVLANALFDYIFASHWQSFGIALATSAVYYCTALLLLFLLRRTIGRLDLFTPPHELAVLMRRLRGAYHLDWRARKHDRRSPRLSKGLGRLLACTGALAGALFVGAASALTDAALALRVSVGVPVMLVFLRYRFVLLLGWALAGVLVGSTLPVFNGNNLVTVLTVPTLLVLAVLPVTRTCRRLPALAFLFAYLLWILVGIRVSPLDIGSFMKTWTVYLDFAAVAILTINVVTTRRRMVGLIDCMLAIGAFVALYGIAGYITQQNGTLDSETGTFRITSVFTAAPALALFLSTLIPLATYHALTSRGLRRLAASLTILLLLAAVGLTFTRGAIISVPLSSMIAALFLPSRKLRAAAIACIVTLVGLMVLVTAVGSIPLLDRFFQQDIASVNGRTYLWQALLMRLDAGLVFGNGLGASTALLMKLQIGNNGIVGNGLIATAPSNLFVGTLFDQGLGGLLLLLATLGSLVATLLTGALRTRGEHRLLFSIAIAVLVNMILLSVEQDDFWTQGIALYFWIIMVLPFTDYWIKASQHSAAALESVS